MTAHWVWPFLFKKYWENISESVSVIISQNDPKLKTNEGINLKNLLYLFERDVAIKTLQAG